MDTPDTAVITETTAQSRSGIALLIAELLLIPISIVVFIVGAVAVSNERSAIGSTLIIIAFVISVALIAVALGFYMVQPNHAAVLTMFGDYRGTDSHAGLRWANPFYAATPVSLRVRNFTTETSKVNDARGNPIEIGAVVVWRVVDTARAIIGVDAYIPYVQIQAESAVRHLARLYPYDAFDDDDVVTLIGDTNDINANLLIELQDRAADAGVEIIETRINDLAYAPEIAESMLKRQQAEAIVAARKKIVEGAVLMVRDAVSGLESGEDDEAITLDSDRKATFAANLMTVIASDQPTNPVVNVGTLTR